MQEEMTYMEKERLKEAVLVNLRSVTQSSKGGVLLCRLQEDYRKLIGTVIPFQPLGYNTLEQFLNDIPNVVQIKRKSDGQLYVEAIIDASTAHLASLISKQKGATAKSSTLSKKRVRTLAYKTAGNKPGNSFDEKDKIIEDLRSELERERMIARDFSSQMISFNSIIAAGQNTLSVEQNKVRQLEFQLQAFKKNEEKIKNSKEDNEVYIKAINNLKTKLLEQEEISKRLLTKVESFNSVNLSRLKDEESAILHIKKEVDDLIEKKPEITVLYSLSNLRPILYERLKRLEKLKISMEFECEQEENASNDSSTDDNNNYSNILNLYSEQSDKIKNLETQLEEQSRLMKSFADKYEKQFKSIDKVNIQYNKRLQKMDSKFNNECEKSKEMKNSLEQLTNYFKTLVLNQEKSAIHGNQSQPAGAENGENDNQEESSDISSLSFDINMKKKKKRKKSKEVVQSTPVYVPPHRRT